MALYVTALVLHELTDLLPGKLHLTVPPRFEKRPPRGVVLHKPTLAERDVENRKRFRVTSALRTLLDAIESPDVPRAELARAVEGALERGLVPRSALIQAAGATTGSKHLAAVLGRKRRGAKHATPQ